MEVKVIIDGTRIPVGLPNDATVKDLKEAVHDVFNFYAVKNIELHFNGVVLENDTKLETYQVVNGSEISLRLLYTVGIVGKNPNGQYKRYEVRAHLNNTVGELKQKLHVDHGLDITNMRFQMKPTSYLDDRTFLWANEITDSSDIYIAED
ncbi:unnamed protein product [Dovyalis caffra]|uniref:Ubiquitin-like domain-containing protein n=1 Tax=Dovyalis caffra TaxID=77055 RepID=A0AAV1SKV8_9ROSI|nr:unnamed protein product [Dovyalis caffra]